MKSGFYNKYSAYTDNKQDILELIRPLNQVMRTATLGLVAGLSPKIVTQTLCQAKAGEEWDLKYSKLLIKDLEKIKLKTPISPLFINNIAKNVFIKRNTIGPHRIHFPLITNQIEIYEIKFDDEQEYNQFFTVLLDSFEHICAKYRRIEECCSLLDFQKYTKISEAINTVSANSNVPNQLNIPLWRQLIAEMIETNYWIVKGADVSSLDVLNEVLKDTFESDIFPVKNIQYPPNWGVLYEAARIYKWFDENSLLEETKESNNEPKSYNEISAEEISDNQFATFFLVEETDTLLFNKQIANQEKELTIALEEYNVDMQKLESLQSLYVDVLHNGITNISLEGMYDLIPGYADSDKITNKEYALESISDTIKAILEFLAKHIHKIIPIILGIIFSIIAYLAKKHNDSNTDNTASGDAVSAKMKTNQIIKENQNLGHVPTKEELGIDSSIVEAIEASISLKYNTHLDLWALLADPKQVKSAMAAILTILSEHLTESRKMFTLVEELIKSCMDPRALPFIIKDIENVFYIDNAHLLPYTRKHLIERVKSLSNFNLANSGITTERKKELFADVKFTPGPGNAFWAGRFHDESDKYVRPILDNNICTTFKEEKVLRTESLLNTFELHYRDLNDKLKHVRIDDLEHNWNLIKHQGEEFAKASSELSRSVMFVHYGDEAYGGRETIIVWPDELAGEKYNDRMKDNAYTCRYAPGLIINHGMLGKRVNNLNILLLTFKDAAKVFHRMQSIKNDLEILYVHRKREEEKYQAALKKWVEEQKK